MAIVTRIRRRLVHEFALRRARRMGVRCEAGVRFHGRPILDCGLGGTISLGARVSLISDPEMTALAVAHPVVLRLLRAEAQIRVGADVGMSGTTICAAQSIIIGAETMIGADVIIADTDFHAIEPDGRRYENRPERIACAPVEIGSNVFIGARSIVLKGVKIGANSVIGAGSIVTKDIPSNVIAGGNPCRVLGQLPQSSDSKRSDSESRGSAISDDQPADASGLTP